MKYRNTSRSTQQIIATLAPLLLLILCAPSMPQSLWLYISLIFTEIARYMTEVHHSKHLSVQRCGRKGGCDDGVDRGDSFSPNGA